MAALLMLTASASWAGEPPAAPMPNAILPGFHRSPWFGEQVREEWIDPGVRVLINAPAAVDPTHLTRLIFYATPNGNTIEQTLGCTLTPGLDWHFDIQHVAAQIRRLREVSPDENIVLACVQADTLSWPAWRQKNPDNGARIRSLVESIRAQLPGTPVRVTLSGHSGGGSFLFGFLNAADTIPDDIDRIAFLDANYSYSDTDHHGDKLLAWLKADPSRHLVVIAYDDRNITLNGKKVVGPDGGTFRASGRMRDRFVKDLPLGESRTGDVETCTGLDGRILFRIHTNPQNRILHTVLVGEMNGLLEALTQGTPQSSAWGSFGEPRAYTKWVQPATGIPTRPADAPGGAAFMARIADLPPAEREEAIATEICRGNIPDFLRTFQAVTLSGPADASGKSPTVTCDVTPDYLAVGSDTDFVRVPMTPMTAQRIADAFGCSLPTRKLVDAIYQQAAVKLEPRPLTEAREAVTTFVQHNAIVEQQRAGKPLGLLVAGIQKDVVLTNRLGEKPNRVAIYGWHKLDGTPIQPLTIVHRDTYVDYSHGIRLIKRTVLVDGKPHDIRDLLHDPVLSHLLSDEGPLTQPTY